MTSLPTLPHSLPQNQPPPGYGCEERDMSVLSTTTASNNAVDQRDTFLGQRRCIVCGASDPLILQHCHIIRDPVPKFWTDLEVRGWVPTQGKALPHHEPSGSLLMCSNHRLSFDKYDFFIRFLPDIRKFVFVNYSKKPILEQFHGKAIGLDIMDRQAPFASLFILHEIRVRGFHPFEPIEPAVPNDVPWQDWILSDSVFSNATGSFRRDSPLDDRDNTNNSFSAQSQPQFQPTTMSTGDASSGERRIALNEDVIAEILAVTRAMPSWKACEVDGTSWTDMAHENIDRYVYWPYRN